MTAEVAEEVEVAREVAIMVMAVEVAEEVEVGDSLTSAMNSVKSKTEEAKKTMEEIMEWSEPGEYSLQFLGATMFLCGGFFGTLLLAFVIYKISYFNKSAPAKKKEAEQEAPPLEA